MQPPLGVELPWNFRPKACLSAAHLVKFLALSVVLFFEDLFLLLLLVFLLEFGDDFLLLLAALAVLEVVQVKLVL